MVGQNFVICQCKGEIATLCDVLCLEFILIVTAGSV